MATTNTTTVDRLFNALNEGSAAVMEAIKAGNERTYRVSRAYLDEAERGAERMLELGKRFADAPGDFTGLSALAIAKAGDAQRGAQQLARQTWDEFVAASREARETVQKIVGANRELGDAYASAVRGRTGDLLKAVPGATNASRPEPARPSTPRRPASTQDVD